MNKRTLFLLLLSLSISFSAIAQSKTDRTVVGKVGKQKITYGELKKSFNSGVQRDNITIQDLEDFLPVYLDYRAKVNAANDKGYFENETVQSEYEQYAKQAAYAYWLENEIKPTRFDEYYSRSVQEVYVEHVLISLDDRATSEDTLKAYNSLMEARKEFENGKSFAELNELYSTKRNGRPIGGELPWISVGVTVPDFEEVAFTSEIGEASMPFRTQFGYHILTVKDKRDRTPSKLISHIFRRALPSDTVNMQWNKMNEAYQALTDGRTWAEVVKEYSEDNLSMTQQGNIGWISYSSRYNSLFIDQIMGLSDDVDITGPMRSVYGYHIFKIDSVQTFTSEEDRREKTYKEFETTPYYVRSNATVIRYIRDVSEEVITIDHLLEYENAVLAADTTQLKDLNISDSILDKQFYSFNGSIHSLKEYHEFLKETKPSSIGRAYKRTWTNGFYTSLIDEQIADLTVTRFDAFSDQLQSYLEGLAVFKINDDNVWSAATVDTTRLEEIFEANASKFNLEARNYYHLISVRTDSSLADIIAFVQEGNSPDSLRSNFDYVGVSVDSSNTFTGEPFDKLDTLQEGSFSEEFEYKRRKAIFYLNKKLPARAMTFEEAFSRLLADFQPTREEEWLKTLRKKYKVKADVKKLRKAFDSEQKSI